MKDGAEGRFSHVGVGKIFDIYLCNMKNFNVKAINSPNTSLVGWFQTQTICHYFLAGWGGNKRKVQILACHFKWNFCPQHLIWTEKIVESLYGPRVKSKFYNPVVYSLQTYCYKTKLFKWWNPRVLVRNEEEISAKDFFNSKTPFAVNLR